MENKLHIFSSSTADETLIILSIKPERKRCLFNGKKKKKMYHQTHRLWMFMAQLQFLGATKKGVVRWFVVVVNEIISLQVLLESQCCWKSGILCVLGVNWGHTSSSSELGAVTLRLTQKQSNCLTMSRFLGEYISASLDFWCNFGKPAVQWAKSECILLDNGCLFVCWGTPPFSQW